MKKLSKQIEALFIALVSITNLERFFSLQSMRLRNKHGSFDFTMIVVSLVTATGIFRTRVNVGSGVIIRRQARMFFSYLQPL